MPMIFLFVSWHFAVIRQIYINTLPVVNNKNAIDADKVEFRRDLDHHKFTTTINLLFIASTGTIFS
jgi:hypothetical protein